MGRIKKLFRTFLMETLSITLALLAVIIPKKKGLILLGAFNGDHFGDNAAFVFSKAQTQKNVQVIWLSNSKKVVKEIQQQGGKALLRRSLKGIWMSLRAPVIASSHSIKDVLMFIPFKGFPHFVYLHHGIPMRKGWLHLKNAPPKARQAILQKTRKAQAMIAPSRYAAEIQNKMYPAGLEKYKITGLPRNDVFFTKKAAAVKKELHIDPNKKIILYAPTWRPWGATTFFPFPDFSARQLDAFLKENNLFLLLRPHHLDLNHEENKAFWQSAKKMDDARIITHAECADINILALISDVLITDYSSLYFDYLLLDRPTIFLDYDLKKYESEIGFYINYPEIAIGPHPKTWETFKTEILLQLKKDPHQKKRQELLQKFHRYRDGNASERVLALLEKLSSNHYATSPNAPAP